MAAARPHRPTRGSNGRWADGLRPRWTREEGSRATGGIARARNAGAGFCVGKGCVAADQRSCTLPTATLDRMAGKYIVSVGILRHLGAIIVSSPFDRIGASQWPTHRSVVPSAPDRVSVLDRQSRFTVVRGSSLSRFAASPCESSRRGRQSRQPCTSPSSPKTRTKLWLTALPHRLQQ